ncbi:MAG: hypothetical protein ABIP03_15205, partial [Aquihabitans sp.]
MWQILVILGLVAVATVAAQVLRRRDGDAPEQGRSWVVPTQLDRDDFDRPDAPWLVTVFTSSTCLACDGTWTKAEILESPMVAVQHVDSVDRKDL